MAHYFLGGAYAASSRHEEAIAILERAATLSDRASFYLGWLGWAYGMATRRAEAQQVLDELNERAQHTYVAPTNMAVVSSGLGDSDQCMEWLETGYRGRDPMMVWLRFPTFDNVRSDPGFQDLLRRMNLPE